MQLIDVCNILVHNTGKVLSNFNAICFHTNEGKLQQKFVSAARFENRNLNDVSPAQARKMVV